MANELTNFLIELSSDPGARARFQEEPETAMSAAGLSEEQQAAVLSEDPNRIRDAILPGGEVGGTRMANILEEIIITVVIRF
jgi:hypothetical protein